MYSRHVLSAYDMLKKTKMKTSWINRGTRDYPGQMTQKRIERVKNYLELKRFHFETRQKTEDTYHCNHAPISNDDQSDEAFQTLAAAGSVPLALLPLSVAEAYLKDRRFSVAAIGASRYLHRLGSIPDNDNDEGNDCDGTKRYQYADTGNVEIAQNRLIRHCTVDNGSAVAHPIDTDRFIEPKSHGLTTFEKPSASNLWWIDNDDNES
ncbi:MAG: hypothetical protein ASARMPRED_004133 [Alectoria sarmentosa]|nr:MAG: hypothetical protein ASARMPRED_004133 [Alectoria sarmentosa]